MENLCEPLLNYDCRFVRLQAYKAMLWVADFNKVKDIVRRFKIETKRNFIWEPVHYHGKWIRKLFLPFIEILLNLFEYSKVNEPVIELVTDLCYHLCVYYPQKIDSDMLIRLFTLLREYKQKVVTEYFLKVFYIW